MNKDLEVFKGNTVQVVVLELPDVDLEIFCPIVETGKSLTAEMAVTGPFCSLSYMVLILFLVRACPGSGTTSMMS